MDFRLTLSGDAAAGIVLPFVALLIGWIAATIGRVQVANRQAEAWARLVDKLDADQAAALFETEGERALDTVLGGPERPHGRIIRAAQVSVVLFTMGAALLWYSFRQPGLPAVLGVLVVALAMGFAGAAAVGYWLSVRWGLLSRGEGPRPPG